LQKKPYKHPKLFFNGTVVNKLDEHEHLGLVLESTLSFSKHITEKTKKAKQRIGILKHISRYLPLHVLDQIYKAVVRPHFDYCDVIYHIPSTFTKFGGVLHFAMKELEKAQYLAARAITGAWQGSSRSKLYEELGWESLSDRRWCRRILQVSKIVNEKTPSYLRDKLPRYRRPLYRQNNTNIFYEINCNSNRYMNSFFPDGTKAWNTQIRFFTEVPSFNILKKHILSLIRPNKKSTFRIHDPLGLRYIFYLRLGLSPLKSHKNHHGFLDTPHSNCYCNCGIEDTHHYFFSCTIFSLQRVTLIASVTRILQKYNLENLVNQIELYLYGHPTIDFIDNKNIILHTIKFVKDTKRFTT